MRRASRRRALVPVTLEQLRERFALFGGRCAYCGAGGRLTVDHVLPLTAGGLDQADNIAPACGRCNSSKGPRPVREWFEAQPFFEAARWRALERHCPASTGGQLPLGLGEVTPLRDGA
jgi:5-methylcytosine-specific restriction endonuclease McrA